MNVTRMSQPWFIVLILVLFTPSVTRADDPEIESVEVKADDESAAFSLGLDAQVRYGIQDRDGVPSRSGYEIRRLRPILEFEAFEEFEVKVVPEFAGDPELKDGIVIWSPTDSFSLEAGQFAPPFNWERDGSSDYHQFTERSVANREFQIADGRDIGLQFDWEWEKLLDVEAGVFNGAGSNTAPEPGRGQIVTGRVAYAPLGAYHEVEVVPNIIANPVFMVAAGGFFAFDNTWRDWAPGLDIDTSTPADVWSVTADAHLWVWRFSIHTQGFYREVEPNADTFDYASAGFTGQAGVLIVDELLLAAFRYSHAVPDIDSARAAREIAAALQIFHLGNRSKFTLDGGLLDRESEGLTERYIRLQYQMLL